MSRSRLSGARSALGGQCRQQHQGQPGAVGFQFGEGEPAQPGVFQSFDVVLHMGVCSHGDIQADRAA